MTPRLVRGAKKPHFRRQKPRSGAKWGKGAEMEGHGGAQLGHCLAANWARAARACADGAETADRARATTRALLVEAAAEPIFHAAGE